jgi:phytanoyl-CoA hydroxylase
VTALSVAQQAAWARDGFLVLPGFVEPAACRTLMARAEELTAEAGQQVVSVFSTHEQERTSDEWFLSSGGEVRAFFEEDGAAVNKLGHAMHDLDPVYERFSRTPELAAVTRDLGIEQPLLLQSMHIFKGAHVGGEVTCHQDASFLFTEPVTVVGLWFALEDATIENGCLWAAPGGHRGPLRQRFVRNGGDADGTRFEVLDTTPLPEPGSDALVALEVRAGTLVALHGLLPHWSGPNRSARGRQAYSLHCIDGRAAYPSDNWLRRPPSQPLRGF